MRTLLGAALLDLAGLSLSSSLRHVYESFDVRLVQDLDRKMRCRNTGYEMMGRNVKQKAVVGVVGGGGGGRASELVNSPVD